MLPHLGGQLVIEVVFADLAVQVGQAGGEPVEDGVVESALGGADRRTGPLTDVVEGQLIAGDADDSAVQQPTTLEPI